MSKQEHNSIQNPDLRLALELADASDEIALARFRALDLKVETKPDRTPVTDADRAVETRMRAIIAAARPQDAFIGEEFENTAPTTKSEYQGPERAWIIDPIDGTANYLRGVPIWASLIALRVAGKVQVGVVSAPALGRRWWAASGEGAFTSQLDGTVSRLQVSSVSQLADASISYNSLQLWDQSGLLPQLIKLSQRVWRTRAYGDFYSYMLLAEGGIDAVAEHDLKIYDIAALVPIIQEAGGQFSDLGGALTNDSSSVLASNGLVHDSISAMLSPENS